MDHEIFSDIIRKLDAGESPGLDITVGEKKYVRRFIGADRLILLGGGHVSLDVYKLALSLDFDIVVIDDRPDFAALSRFPEAKVICGDFKSSIEALSITGRDYVCVLTRGHKWDRKCVETILSGQTPRYLGMISSRRRAEGLKALLAEEGYAQSKLDMLTAPIGLPIGAVTTAEIAVSICAQMISERNKTRRKPAENELMQTNVNMKLLNYLSDPPEPCAFLIVLSSVGSTPVKSGSMMAVNISGETCGTIGGGCSEAASLIQARGLIGTGESKVITFDMSDEAAADNGMVCGGEMTVYIADISQ